jgi:hypothetical protein
VVSFRPGRPPAKTTIAASVRRSIANGPTRLNVGSS